MLSFLLLLSDRGKKPRSVVSATFLLPSDDVCRAFIKILKYIHVLVLLCYGALLFFFDGVCVSDDSVS